MNKRRSLNGSVLSSHSGFKYLKENCNVSWQTPRNILDSKQNSLFAWNEKEKSLIALYINHGWDIPCDHIPMQKYVPLNPPTFKVNRILLNNTARSCALIGPCGVALLDLPPARWPSDPPQTRMELPKEYCGCKILEQNLYSTSNNVTTVLQVRWYPNSCEEQTLAVLSTDDTLRFYNAASKELIVMSSLTDTESLSRKKNRKQTLGIMENATVDFDFGLPVRESKNGISDIEKKEYSIVILKYNGSVYILQDIFDKYKSCPRLIGPLEFAPPLISENLSTDEPCSLIVIRNTVPVVVVANAVGTIYQAFLIDERCGENSSKGQIAYPESVKLYMFDVFENVFKVPNTDDNTDYVPVALYKDQFTYTRYFVTHCDGVHSICLKALPKIEKFITDDSNGMPGLESTIEYVLCTRLEGQKFSSKNSVAGLTMLEDMNKLVIVCGTGDVYCMELCNVTESEDVQKADFGEVSQSPNTSKTIFSPNTRKGASKGLACETLEKQAHILREEYLKKYVNIINSLAQRASVLSLTKNRQLQNVEELKKETEKIREKAERLAELYEDLEEKQNTLHARLSEVTFTIWEIMYRDRQDKKNPVTELSIRAEVLKERMENIRNIYKTSVEQKLNKTAEVQVSRKDYSMLKNTLFDMASEVDKMTAKVSSLVDTLQSDNA